MPHQPAPFTASSETATDQRRPHLVVVRVGDGSLHPTWTQGERNFDLVVDYYGDTPGRWDGTADLVVENKGSKWKGLHALLRANPGLLDGYDAVWFPDDDIATDAATISELFELHANLGLGISQPSLTTDSYFTHLTTLTHPGLLLRVTNFVEVMVPVFSRAALEACLPTFAESESGYGLDLVWQGILPGLGLESGIFDCVSVRHTRPLGGGTLYASMQEPPHREGARVARKHGMPTPHEFLTRKAVQADGTVVDAARAEELVLANPPQPTVQPVPAWDLYLDEVRTRVAARAAGTLRPGPFAAPARPAPPATALPPSTIALDRLDEEAPLVLVVGDPAAAAARVGAWEALGWQAVVVPAGSARELGAFLAGGERFAARAVDVEERSSHALDRAVEFARSAGFEAVVRVGGAVLACEHRTPEPFLQAFGRCEACVAVWKRIAAGSTQVVVPGAGERELLTSLGLAAPLLRPAADLATVGTWNTAPAPAEGTSVVVFARSTGEDVERLLSALARQRGLAARPEVLIVPPAPLRNPGLATTDHDGMRVTVTGLAGPAGFQQALTAAGRPRVLVLDSNDVPGPWCVHDHERGAAAAGRSAVVRTPARAALDGPDDPFTAGLHARVADGAVPGPGVRCSAPTVLARELAAVHGVASASAATAVLGAGRAALDLRRPTHAATPLTDLAALRAGTVLSALAAGTVASPFPDDLRTLGRELTFFSHRGGVLAALAGEMLPLEGDVLRSVVLNHGTGERGSDLARGILAGELAAHWAAASTAADAVRRAAERGQPFTLGLDGGDDRLVPLLRDLRDALDPAHLQVRIVVAPGTDLREFAIALSGRLRDVGVDVADLPSLDLQHREGPVSRALDVDVVLPVDGDRWFPGLPVPMLALAPVAWLSYLGVVALLTRREAPVPSSTDNPLADRRTTSC